MESTTSSEKNTSENAVSETQIIRLNALSNTLNLAVTALLGSPLINKLMAETTNKDILTRYDPPVPEKDDSKELNQLKGLKVDDILKEWSKQKDSIKQLLPEILKVSSSWKPQKYDDQKFILDDKLLNENEQEKQNRINSLKLLERLNDIKNNYIVQEDGKIVIKPIKQFENVEIVFQKLEKEISNEATSIQSTANNKTNSYSPQKVERLLNEAIDLLDRGIRDRTEWDDKISTFFKQVLELNEFFRLDENLKKQEQNGYYTQEYDKLSLENEVEKNNLTKYKSAYDNITEVITKKFSEQSYKDQVAALEKTNVGANYFTGWDGGSNFHKATLRTGQDFFPYDLVNQGSFTSLKFSLDVQKALYQIQQSSIDATVSASSSRLAYLNDKLKSETNNIKYLKQKDDILRQSYIVKLSSMLAEDGVLNQFKRLKPLKKRFINDFIEAYSRLKAAEYGISKIFGYNEKLPSEKSIKDSGFFDNCLDWARNGINFINRFKQSEVNGIIPISIRNKSVANYTQFLNSYNSGKWVFELTEDDLKNKYNVRLKAVSVTLSGLGKNYKTPNLDGCFSSKIHTPVSLPSMQNSFTTMKYNDLISGQIQELSLKDFPKIPEVIIGRVFSNEYPRPVEVAGIDTLFNCSPIGSWAIEIIPISRSFYYQRDDKGVSKKEFSNQREGNQSTPFSNADLSDDVNEFPKFISEDFFDIQLDLHIAYKMNI